MNVLAVECFPQSCFRVFCAETVQTNIPLAAGRLDAHMSASLDPASRFFHQLHERVKSIWLHPQCSVNCDSQRITARQFGLIALPFLIRNGFVLRNLNDRKMMLTTKLVTDLSNKPAGVPHISEFMGAVQRRCAENNVVMKRILSRNILSIEKSCSFPFNNNSPGLLRLQTKIGWHCCKHFLSATVPICLCFSFSPLNIYT